MFEKKLIGVPGDRVTITESGEIATIKAYTTQRDYVLKVDGDHERAERDYDEEELTFEKEETIEIEGKAYSIREIKRLLGDKS